MLILVRRPQICNTLFVSTLASCQKLPTTVPDLANRPRQLVFLTNSQLNDFLNEVHQIARLEPSIVERIDEDLDVARGVWGATEQNAELRILLHCYWESL